MSPDPSRLAPSSMRNVTLLRSASAPGRVIARGKHHLAAAQQRAALDRELQRQRVVGFSVSGRAVVLHVQRDRRARVRRRLGCRVACGGLRRLRPIHKLLNPAATGAAIAPRTAVVRKFLLSTTLLIVRVLPSVRRAPRVISLKWSVHSRRESHLQPPGEPCQARPSSPPRQLSQGPVPAPKSAQNLGQTPRQTRFWGRRAGPFPFHHAYSRCKCPQPPLLCVN